MPIKHFTRGIFDGPHATPPEATDGPVFLGIKNITSDGRLDMSEVRHVGENHFPRWTRRVTPQEDDVVFTYEATLHRYARIPEGFRGCLGRRVALVRPDPEKLESRYLLYFFLSPNWHATIDPFIITGATVDRIPIEKFPDIQVEFPPLPTQHRIADILSAYDDAIENNRRRIKLLEDAARHLYEEWFVRLRFPGHERVRIKDGVPEGWESRTLGTHAGLHYGKGLRKDDRVEGPFPVYGSSGIVGTHDEALVKGPVIIVGRKGTVGSVIWSQGDCWPIDTVYFIPPEKSTLYLYHNLQYQNFISTDVAVPGLNRSYAHSLPVLVPPPTLESEFESFAGDAYGQINALRRTNTALRRSRDLLLPQLMSGEIAA